MILQGLIKMINKNKLWNKISISFNILYSVPKFLSMYPLFSKVVGTDTHFLKIEWACWFY